MARTEAEDFLLRLMQQSQPNIQQGLQTENQDLRTRQTASGLAQRFLQGNVNVPVPVDEREAIESARREGIVNARSLPAGGLQRSQEQAVHIQAAADRAKSQRAASDRLFNRLNVPVSTPITGSAVSGAASLAGTQFDFLNQQIARRQQQEQADEAFWTNMIKEVADALGQIDFSKIF